MRTISAVLAMVIFVCVSASAQPHGKKPASKHSQRAGSSAATSPDDVFFNGVIYTGEGLAEDKPAVVEAMAVAKGKVIAVGSTAQITKLAGKRTRLHDMGAAQTRMFIFP